MDTKKPVGNGINAPVMKDGVETLISTMSADTTNSGTDLNQSASSENLSAKFKNPNVKTEIASEAQGQYM